MLKIAKEYFDLGFTLLWLHPKSKRPIETGWTKKPRQNWEDFKKNYKAGMNLGVRLGTPSKIKGFYLGVIDCDVKDPSKKKEVLDKVASLFDADFIRTAPTVSSGRGNGSCHLYFLSKIPPTPKRLAQSPDTVLVHMPGSSISKREQKEVGPLQLKAGMRLRPAWEISLMGDNQQVVLPPSIHPDSKKEYRWAQDLSRFPLQVLDISELVPEKTERAENSTTTLYTFKDVDLTRLPHSLQEAITDGSGVEDRSSSLLFIAKDLIKFGLNRNEILSILTDRNTFIGETAYDHAKTNNREKAARWIEKYTLNKAFDETDFQRDFDGNVEVEGEEDWFKKLDFTQKGIVRDTLRNIKAVLVNRVGKTIFIRNEFLGTEHYGLDTPWKGKAGNEIRDIDLIAMKNWFADEYKIEPNTNLLNEVVGILAHENPFHPIKKYLLSLEWDEKPRIEGFLETYFGASGGKEYLREVSRKVLTALIARVFEPGIKFDHVLILEGVQGIGKSTCLEKLVGEEWFSDTHIDIKDKDAILTMRGKWLIELGELSGMRKADVDHFKEFVSRRVDRMRVPYGRRSENFPRQCVFIGTTNLPEFLKDETGNRRFWPVKVLKSDFKAIERDRDQLLAEAVSNYFLGETLFLEDSLAKKQAENEQEKRVFEDIWVVQLRKFFKAEKMKKKEEKNLDISRFSVHELFSDFGPFRTTRDDVFNQKRAVSALRKLGFVQFRERIPGEGRPRLWRKRTKDHSQTT